MTLTLLEPSAGLVQSSDHWFTAPVFRNESHVRSSDLIREAMDIAFQRWPGERLYTYVNPERIRSTNPGYCFLCAGWRRCGITKDKGLIILEAP